MTGNHKSWTDLLNELVIRVTYRDTDQMGVVYYANYLVWFEMGRTELLRQTGHTYRQLEERGVILPVARCECDYKKPARYDDLVRIQTSILRLTDVSIVFQYRVLRDETGELLARGITKHAMIDREGRLVRGGAILEKWFS